MTYISRDFSTVTPGRRLTDFEKQLQAHGAREVPELRKSLAHSAQSRPGTVKLVRSIAREGTVKLIAGGVKLIR